MFVNELAKEWNNAGVKEGDTLLLHSSTKSTLKRYLKQRKRIDSQTILDSFLTALGPNGTLILPLFNFEFTEGIPFNYKNTPSHMGALTEAGRLHPQAVRTGHPIYSFAVIGKNANKFKDVNNFSGYGADSPFAILRKLNGKIASLNLPDQNSMTFYHHVEEMHEVPYRYHKTFSGEYVGADGHTENRTYGLFVRNIDKGVLTHVDPAGELMWEKGLYSGYRPGEGCGLRIISAQKMYDFVENIILSGNAKGLLYRIEGEDNE